MARKNVVFIIKSNPFSWKTFEALRQAVGASIEHNESEAVRERGIKLKDWGVEIDIMDKDHICNMTKDAEVVITW